MKAVLVFCEGRHDIVFVQRSLGAIARCTWLNVPIGELPSPFGAATGLVPRGLVAKRYGNRHLDELHLQAAGHPPLPSFESVVEHKPSDTIYLMVRTHGQDQTDAVIDLLGDLNTILDAGPPGTFDVDEYAAAFVFDADEMGVEATIDVFRDRYRGFFDGLDPLVDQSWVVVDTVPVGCFVFHQDGTDTGTLEDHLGPMVESVWPERTKATAIFIDGEKEADDLVSGKSSERWKAVITTAGQFNHPGDPMSEIIGRYGLPRAPFESSALCLDLVGFLSSVPWSYPSEPAEAGQE